MSSGFWEYWTEERVALRQKASKAWCVIDDLLDNPTGGPAARALADIAEAIEDVGRPSDWRARLGLPEKEKS